MLPNAAATPLERAHIMEERDALAVKEDNMERLKEAPIQTSKAQADAEADGKMYKSHARAEVSNKGNTKFGSFVRKM